MEGSQPWRSEWGPRLRAARRAAGLSQTVVAYHCGVGQQMVSYWERGKAAPRDAKRVILSRLLGVPIADLFPYPDNGEGEAA